MFKDKHVYTCPDVIHLRQKSRTNARNAIIANLVLAGFFVIAGRLASKQLEKEFDQIMEEVPDPNET